MKTISLSKHIFQFSFNFPKSVENRFRQVPQVDLDLQNSNKIAKTPQNSQNRPKTKKLLRCRISRHCYWLIDRCFTQCRFGHFDSHTKPYEFSAWNIRKRRKWANLLDSCYRFSFWKCQSSKYPKKKTRGIHFFFLI